MHQSPSGCHFTTRVRVRIMNRPAGFWAIRALGCAALVKGSSIPIVINLQQISVCKPIRKNMINFFATTHRERSEWEMAGESITSMYELLTALFDVIKAAPKAERETLAAVMDDYAKDFPEEYFWATGAQSPALLYNLMSRIEMAATGDVLGPWQKKGRVVNLVTRAPEGNA